MRGSDLIHSSTKNVWQQQQEQEQQLQERQGKVPQCKTEKGGMMTDLFLVLGMRVKSLKRPEIKVQCGG